LSPEKQKSKPTLAIAPIRRCVGCKQPFFKVAASVVDPHKLPKKSLFRCQVANPASLLAEAPTKLFYLK
jgi:hypothetical protein